VDWEQYSCIAPDVWKILTTNSGSVAILTPIRRASSRVIRLAADRQPDSSELLPAVIAHDKTLVQILDGLGRREALMHINAKHSGEVTRGFLSSGGMPMDNHGQME
jgi:hypothetical protein